MCFLVENNIKTYILLVMFMFMFMVLLYNCFLHPKKKKKKNHLSSNMLWLCSLLWLNLKTSSKLLPSPCFLVLCGECSIKLEDPLNGGSDCCVCFFYNLRSMCFFWYLRTLMENTIQVSSTSIPLFSRKQI